MKRFWCYVFIVTLIYLWGLGIEKQNLSRIGPINDAGSAACRVSVIQKHAANPPGKTKMDCNCWLNPRQMYA